MIRGNKNNVHVIQFPSSTEHLKKRLEKIKSFRKKLDERRSVVDKIADEITNVFGSVSFFFWNAIFFTAWIVLNINMIPGLIAFDPFPFGLLTMIVSLEAIFLSVFVLISQNRQARIADLREEIDLQINLIAEKEITKLIQMQAILMKHQGITIEGDTELEEMMRHVDAHHIQRQLEKEEIKSSSSSLIPIIPTPNAKSINGVIKKLTKFIESSVAT